MTISETDRARIVEAMARAMWLGPRPDLISGTALAILQRDAAAALDAALSAGLADAIRGTAEARVKELEEALEGVIRVADRDCPEFRAARAALEQQEK
jgi:hypothetical protein